MIKIKFNRFLDVASTLTLISGSQAMHAQNEPVIDSSTQILHFNAWGEVQALDEPIGGCCCWCQSQMIAPG